MVRFTISTIFKTAIVLLFSYPGSCIQLYPIPAAAPSDIPAPCRAALAAKVACGPRFIKAPELKGVILFNNTFLREYCNSTCSTSFNSFITTIGTRCGNTVYDFEYGVEKSAIDMVAPLKWARDTACLTGTSPGDYCIPKIYNGTLDVCDDCVMKYLAAMLSNTAGLEMISEEKFTSIASSCKVEPTKYPHPTISLPEPPTTTAAPNNTCFDGKFYTVKQGDTCESISKSNSMAIDGFLDLNNLDVECKLLKVGNSVCIRDACKTFTIPAGQTCDTLSKRLGFTKTELLYWNPVLGSSCDNLDSMKGRTICITPPGTNTYSFRPTATWDDAWTWPDGSWTGGPTQGTPLGNTTEFQFTIPTETLSLVESPNPTLAEYYKWCPITSEMWDEGFSWEGLSTGCMNLLEKYCLPKISGSPLPSTSFPPTCFPPYADPTDAP
ncbi:hypothetical protein BS50DRAFT_651680 [Corynespora cassiicola Philippines]|uniref:LysM domain-containing protein n=1 Tax=Corynespora cassiicola Philippines TaxID=1448308 RepID=A0A2T2N7P4_CORCC|nr:hypothetical protein BS50DRAFT_651680 [Corynespora cassiicola Philippines]